MKSTFTNLSRLFVVAILAVLFAAAAFGQATDDYRSAATGNWNAIATWERFNGATWVAAVATPTSANGVITIRSPHVVTISATVTYDQVVVDAGGQVTVASAVTTTMANGAGTDLTINGTWLHSGGTWTVTGTTWAIGAGGTYIHNTTASAATPLALATFDAASTMIYRGSSVLVPAVSLSGRTFGNLSFESTSGTLTIPAPAGATATAINGSLSFGATGAGTVSWVATGYTGVLTIASDLNVGTGSSLTIGANTLTVRGNLINNGTLSLNPGAGSFVFDGTTTVSGTAPTFGQGFKVSPSKTVTLSIPIAIPTTKTGTDSGTINCGTNAITGAGNFTLAGGGTLGIGSVDGITSTPSTGNIQVTGTRSYSSAATYVYNGGSAQVTGNQLPSAIKSLTINNSAGVTLTSSVTDTTLTLTSGNVTTGGNTLTIDNGGSVSRTSGHVVGNLAMTFPINNQPATTFHVGTASAYTPVTLDLDGTGGTAGTFLATTTGSAHGSIATSGLLTAKDIERYWTVTPTTGALGARTYKLKVDFLGGDVTGGADPNLFEFRKYDSGVWTTPTGGTYTRTSTSTQYDNFTSFSDYAVGEAPPVISAASDIIRSNTFTEPTNIPYAANTGSNVTSSNPEVFEFKIRDGGGSADADAYGTELTAIQFTVTNSALLDKIALYDGVTEIQEVSAGASISFSGFSKTAADGDSLALNLRATYKTTDTDHAQFSFQVSSATANPATSTFAAGNAGAAASSTSGNRNKVDVIASKLDFTTEPSASNEETVALATQPAVTARDANNNTDLDYSGLVTLSNTGSLTMTGNAVSAVSGVVSYTALTFTQGGTGIFLSTTNGDGLTNNASTTSMTIYATTPSSQDSAIVFSGITDTTTTISWTNGGGANRIVVASVSTISGAPVDGTPYAANSIFGTGATIAPGEYVVYNGTGSSVTVTGLTASTLYHYRLFAYNNASPENYLTTSVSDNPKNQTTYAAEPATASTSMNFTLTTGNSMTVNWTNGSGPNRIVVAKSGSVVTNVPADGSGYSASATFGSGADLGGSEFVVYNGTGSSAPVSGLSPGITYHFAVFEYAGSGATANYLTTSWLIGNETTLSLSTPTVASPTAANITSSTATLGADVTFDGNVTVTARGIVWSTSANPDTLANRIDTAGTTGAFTVSASGLPSGTLIHYRGFAINGVGVAYTSDATFYTLSTEPSSHAGSFSADAVSTSSIDLTWSVASGADGYIIIQRTGSDPTGTPSDATAYSVSNVIGDGIVAAVLTSGASTSVTISGLTLGTDYHYSIIPYAWDGAIAATYNYRTSATIPTANAVTFNNSSDVVSSPGFVYPTNVNYALYQENTFIDSTNSVAVFKVRVRDGGASTDADAEPTTLTAISFSATNVGYLRRATLYNGTSQIGEMAVTGTPITFSGLTVAAGDDGFSDLTLRVSYKTSVVDNGQYSFTVSSVTANPNGSGFAAANGGGATSSTAGDDNRIEVVASALIFTTQPPVSTPYLTNFSAAVTARDANGLTDVDYAASVTMSRQTGTGTLSAASTLTHTAASGVASWTDLQYNTGEAGVSLKASDGSITDGISNTFTVTVPTSTTSDVVAVASSESATISSIVNTAGPLTSVQGVQVWQVTVRDGGGASDPDAFPTEMIALNLQAGGSNQVTSWSAAVLAADLFDGATHLAAGTIGATSINFSGFSTSAPDNGSKTLSVRISLKNPLPANSDNKDFHFSVANSNVTAGSAVTSSQFSSFSTITSDQTKNKITVSATIIAFSTQPTSNLVFNSNIAPVAVTARDANGNTDLDFANPVTLSSATFTLASTDPGSLTKTPVSGVASWANLSSSVAGTGTVLANAAGMSQAASSPITVLGGIATSIATGNWSAGTTWDQGVKPSALQAAVIANGHVVTLTANDTCAIATVQSGGVLDISTFKLGLAGSYTLNSGGEGRQAAFNNVPGGGATPWAFNAASVYTLYGTATGFSIGAAPGITFGNFNWNITANGTPPVGMVVAGNLSIGGTGEMRGGTGAVTSRVVTVLGNAVINNGVMVVSNSSNPITGGFDIAGNLTINSPGVLRGVNSSGSGTLKIGGSLVNTGGKIRINNNVFGTGDWITYFNGTGAGNFNPGDSSVFKTVAIAPGRTITLLDTLNTTATYTVRDSGSLLCGTKTIAGAGAFTLVSGGTIATGHPSGLSATTGGGTVAVTGARSFSPGGSYIYNGSVAQSANDSTIFSAANLTINNAAGVSFVNNFYVSGAMTLQSGNVSVLGGKTMSIGSSGSVARTSGHVIGKLSKNFGTGASVARSYEIGDATGYTPVDMTLHSVTVGDSLTVVTAGGEHPNLGTSNVLGTKDVNRSYTVTNSDVAFGTADATFHYLLGDVDGIATPANFIVGKFDGGWTYPTVGTKTATSTQATGMTSFSSFAFGEAATFPITSSAGANGNIAPLGTVNVATGAEQQFISTPAVGYHVDSLFVDGVYNADSTTSYTFHTVSAAHTIHVIFKLNGYTITVTQGANGVIAPGTSGVLHGSNKNFAITPNTGYHIDSVKVDGAKVDSTTSYTFINVTTNHSITAFYTINSYALNVSIVGSGTVGKAPNQLSYTHGTPVDLTPNAATGWNFSGWSGDATGNAVPLNVVMTSVKNITATFVLDSVYLTMYRSFAPESIAVDKDNKGKIGKYVARKPDKVDFKAVLVIPVRDTISVKLKFSMVSSGTMTHGTTKTDTIGTWANVKEITLPINLPHGDTVQIDGRGAKGKAIKITYDWAAGATHTKGTLASYLQNQPRLPMPNRVNALFETFEQAGFSGTGGLLVGKDRSADSAKQYGWLQSAKYGDVLKTLYVSKTGTQHTGTPAGFTTFISGKPVVKRQKSLIPTKFNNKLLAEMVAVKFSIAASAMGKTQPGFGELVYNDGTANPLNGLMVKEIAAVGDSVMMGYYAFTVHTFAGQPVFDNLYATIDTINDAFEGAIDTLDFASKLHLTGVRQLIDVPYLRAGTTLPARIVPNDAALYETPVAYRLEQNYPNPFNPTTTISFELPLTSMVTLKIYNMLGQEVSTILENQEIEDGAQEVTFDATSLSTGVYFYRLTAESIADPDEGTASQLYVSVKKMMLIK